MPGLIIRLASTDGTDFGLNRRHGRADLGNMFLRMGHVRHERGAPRRARRLGHSRGFTLIDTLIVVVILGIVAALVMPKFTNASDDTNETSVRRHLQILRHQIEFYRATNRAEPDLLGKQWDDLVTTDHLQSVPVNPYNNSTLVAAAAAPGVGWVWRDNGTGVMTLYATDNTFAEFIE